MRKVFILLGGTFGSWLGWAAGEGLSEDIFVPFFLSAPVSGIGIYLGWRYSEDF